MASYAVLCKTCSVLLCVLEHPRVDNPKQESVAVLICRFYGHGMSKYNENSTSQKNHVEHLRICEKGILDLSLDF